MPHASALLAAEIPSGQAASHRSGDVEHGGFIKLRWQGIEA